MFTSSNVIPRQGKECKNSVPQTHPQAPISRCSALNVLDLAFTQLQVGEAEGRPQADIIQLH